MTPRTTVKVGPRCECSHVEIHHGADGCQHVRCDCRSFVDAAKCPVCHRRYATTRDGFTFCRTCQS